MQVENGCLQCEVRVEKADISNFIVTNDNTKESFKLVNTALAFTVQDARV